MKNLKNINPKYAKHMFMRNQIVENFARDIFGGVDLLEQPMCKCERPGLWTQTDNPKGRCFCPACGSFTDAPVTMRDYLVKELGLLSEEELALIEGGGTLDEFLLDGNHKTR